MNGVDHYLEAEKQLALAATKSADATSSRTQGLTLVLGTQRTNLLATADANDAAAAAAIQTAAVHAALAQVSSTMTPAVIAYRQVRGRTPLADVEVNRWALALGYA